MHDENQPFFSQVKSHAGAQGYLQRRKGCDVKELKGQNYNFQVLLSLLSHPCSLPARVCWHQLAATWHVHQNTILLCHSCLSGASEGHASSLVTATWSTAPANCSEIWLAAWTSLASHAELHAAPSWLSYYLAGLAERQLGCAWDT